MRFVVGAGASGDRAATQVEDGLRLLARHPSIAVVGRSRRYLNPAWGGATRASFVNAAVVIDTPLPPAALLRELHAIENACGRLRHVPSGPRTLDLDLLWGLDVHGGGSSGPVLPHPRLLERAFAVVPALEALESAGILAPSALRAARRRHTTARLLPFS